MTSKFKYIYNKIYDRKDITENKLEKNITTHMGKINNLSK